MDSKELSVVKEFVNFLALMNIYLLFGSFLVKSVQFVVLALELLFKFRHFLANFHSVEYFYEFIRKDFGH
jgi:hypothetical protein